MARYVLLRLVQLLPVLLLASMAIWLMLYLIPGDPAIALMGPDATEEQLRRFMGTHSARKIQSGASLVRALDLTPVPRPLDRVLEHV